MPDAGPGTIMAGWVELENRRVDAVDFGVIDLPLDMSWLLPRALVVVASTAALTAWLLRAG